MGSARDAVRSRASQQRGGGTPPQQQAKGIVEVLNSPATQEQLSRALPPGLSLDRFLRTTRTAIQLDPKLAACDVNSTIAAVHKAATLGLEPNVGQQCYLLPYAGKCTFILGYRGIITLARRSGLITELYARPVYRNEEFDADYGLDGHLVHRPLVDAGAEQVDDDGNVLTDANGKPLIVERGPLRCFYGVAKFQDHAGESAGHYWIVVPMTTIYEHRDASSGWQAYASGTIKDTPWRSNFEAMALKTVIRIMEPQLPLTPEVARAIQNDETWQPNIGREEHQPDVIDTTATEPGPEDEPDSQGEPAPGVEGGGEPAPEPGSQEQPPSGTDDEPPVEEKPQGEAKTTEKAAEATAVDAPAGTPAPAKAAAKKAAAAKDERPKVGPDGFCPECHGVNEHADGCTLNPEKGSGRRTR